MLKFFKRFNEWFDNLPEPRRFLTFIIPMMTGIVMMNLAPPFMYIGIVIYAIILVFAFNRM